jgi:RNase H-fold protein (predicted Holliday junction resolvase)
MRSLPDFETEASGAWWPRHRTVWLVSNYRISLENYLLLTGAPNGQTLTWNKRKVVADRGHKVISISLCRLIAVSLSRTMAKESNQVISQVIKLHANLCNCNGLPIRLGGGRRSTTQAAQFLAAANLNTTQKNPSSEGGGGCILWTLRIH